MKDTIQIWVEDPEIKKDGDFYIAHNKQLQLVACSLNEEEAVENLEGLLKTSFTALAKEGIIFETLDKLNIKYKGVERQKQRGKSNLRPLLVGV